VLIDFLKELSMSKSLIFSRNGNDSELCADRIKQLAPAVFSTSHKETLSSRYQPLNTADLLPVLSDYGFVPTQAVQRFGRKTTAEHNHHMIAFAHRDSLLQTSPKQDRGEIILYNSHDGTGAVRLFAGAYRFICSNGIVAGEGYDNRIYHSRSGLNGFEEMLANTVQSLPKLLNAITMMKEKPLNRDRQVELATQAAQVRWKMLGSQFEDANIRGSFATGQTVADLLLPTRWSDQTDDAWTVFNRVQEGVIRGKAMIQSFTERNPEGVLRKSRPISSVAENVRVNRELWDIAQDVAAFA